VSHNLGGQSQSVDLHRRDIHKYTVLARKNVIVTLSAVIVSSRTVTAQLECVNVSDGLYILADSMIRLAIFGVCF
jgi:hypothetical protein